MAESQSKEAGKIAELFQYRAPLPDLPEYNPEWLNRAPRSRPDMEAIEREVTAALLEAEKTPSPVRRFWPAAAAAVLIIAPALAYFMTRSTQPVRPAGTAGKAVAVFVSGDVQRVTPQGTVKLHPGNVVNEKDLIRTGADGTVDIALSNKSILRMKKNSVLELAVLWKKEAGGVDQGLSLKKGTLLNYVKKRDRGDEYNVSTVTAIASVRGTSFEMTAADKKSTVLVSDGLVQVVAVDKPADAKVLSAGQSITIDGSRAAEPVGAPNRTEQLRAEYEELRKRLAELDINAIQSTLRKPGVKTEADLRRVFDRDIERIILRDGREIRGAVVAQQGSRLVVRSVDDVHIIEMTDILKQKIVR